MRRPGRAGAPRHAPPRGRPGVASYLRGTRCVTRTAVNVPTWAPLSQLSSHAVPVVSGGPGAASLVEKLPVAVLTVDGAARVQYANEQAARLLGTNQSSLVGRTFTRLYLAPEDGWRFTSALHTALGGTPEQIALPIQRTRDDERLVAIHVLGGETPGFAHLVLFDLTDQREIEAALEQSAVLYDTFLEQSPIGLVHLDATGTITFENHRFRQIVGERPEDAWVGLSAFRIAGLDGLFAGAIKRLLNARQIQDFGVRYQPPGGALRHLLLSGSPIRRADGTVTGAVLMVQDVTEERARAREEALRARYARAETALREAVLAGGDERAFLREGARIFAQTTGADRAAFLLAHVAAPAQLYTRAAWGEQAEVLAALRLDLTTTALPDVTAAPLLRLASHAEPAPLTDAAESLLVTLRVEGAFEGLLLLDWFEAPNGTHDASDTLLLGLARLFETLWAWLRTTLRYRLTVATMTDALANFVYEASGARRFLFLTPQVEALTGHAPGAFVEGAQGWARLAYDEAARADLAAHEARLQAGEASELVLRVRHADGTGRWLRERATPHHDADARSYVSLISDVTEQQRAESVLVDATRSAENASRDKTAFIATLSHEIRTPLGTIHGFADLLGRELDEYEAQTGTPLPAPIAEFVATIRERAAQTLALVGDIFDLTSLEAGTLAPEATPTDVNGLAGQVAARYAPVLSEKGVALRLDFDPSDPHVLADAQRFEQIVDNLLSNAVKFTAEGYVAVQTRRMENGVELTVRDTGVGMSEGFQEKLFTPFLQEDQRLNRDYEGMGLGLALVKKLVDLLGGHVRVESRKGEGTTFRVLLPLAER